jgi:ATP-dependent exoDNAse (exonuclease V) beta subunit
LALCGNRSGATLWECLAEDGVQPPLIPSLSEEGQARLAAVVPVLRRGQAAKGRLPLRRLIESTWLGLHGPAGLTAGDLTDAEQFFALLEELDEGGDLVRLETLEERLGKLYAAPDPQAGPGLQLMTIHKAKGLEFDTVILPGLGRSVRPAERSLLLWQEQLDPARRKEGLLLAPIPASTAEDHDPTYRAIASIHAEKEQLETVRLFYVAATRARRRLHLLGHAVRNRSGELSPAAGSLFKAAWPVLGETARQHPVDAAVITPDALPRDLPLLRLPTGWSPPLLAAPLSLCAPAPRRASEAGFRPVASAQLSLRGEEGRIIGTIVHAWLERLARDGLDKWPEERLATIRSGLEGELLRGGVPRSRVTAGAERALSALTTARRSPRGCWLLRAHPEAASELALTGVLDGTPVHAVIDRTFVDDQGVRWVVDYKTGFPSGEESLEDFLLQEGERYRSQLDVYRRLMMLRTPQQTVRTALYFLLLDAWCEVN